MDEQQARDLTVGQRVMWDGDPLDLGRVIEIGWGGVQVYWDDGQKGWIAYQDMALVTLVVEQAEA